MRFIFLPDATGPYCNNATPPARFRCTPIPDGTQVSTNLPIITAESEAAAATQAGMVPIPSTPKVRRQWTALAFFQRFTDAERHTVYAAAAQNPAIQDFVTLGTAAGQIRNDDPKLLTAMSAFVAAGILTPQRRDAILGV